MPIWLLPIAALAVFGAVGFFRTGTDIQDNTKIRFFRAGKIKFLRNTIQLFFDLEVWNYTKRVLLFQEYDIKINFYPGTYGDQKNKKEIARIFKTNGAIKINPGQNIIRDLNTGVDYTFGVNYLLAMYKTGDYLDLQATGFVKVDGLKFPVDERISFKGEV